MIALLYLFGAILTAFVFFFVCCWVMFERDLNADLPNEIREIGLIENARILSTVVYRYWHNQFLEGTYTKQPPVRDAAYACGSEFSSDLGTAEKTKFPKFLREPPLSILLPSDLKNILILTLFYLCIAFVLPSLAMAFLRF